LVTLPTFLEDRFPAKIAHNGRGFMQAGK